jgi:hypothetical protein
MNVRAELLRLALRLFKHRGKRHLLDLETAPAAYGCFDASRFQARRRVYLSMRNGAAIKQTQASVARFR